MTSYFLLISLFNLCIMPYWSLASKLTVLSATLLFFNEDGMVSTLVLFGLTSTLWGAICCLFITGYGCSRFCLLFVTDVDTFEMRLISWTPLWSTAKSCYFELREPKTLFVLCVMYIEFYYVVGNCLKLLLSLLPDLLLMSFFCYPFGPPHATWGLFGVSSEFTLLTGCEL